MNRTGLPGYFQSLLPESITWLQELVSMESHSHDKAGVDALAADLAGRFTSLGANAEVLPVASAGNSLRASWTTSSGGEPALFLGHLDTVWAPGTIQSRPFRIEGGRAFGPGVYDMKAGLVLSLLVCRALKEGKSRPRRDVLFLFTGDEEIGTKGGLPYLKATAKGCRAVFCLEPPLPGGRAKTFRKGVGVFGIQVQGVSAHAGVDPDKGANAILELSRQVVELHGMNNRERGTTVSVGKIAGGTASNVVPAEANAEVDVRVVTVQEGLEIEERIRALQPFDHRCSLKIMGGMNRPPLERTPAVLELYRKARAAALDLGLDLEEGGTGGGSDGSFTAAMGVPTLDGLGVDGDGAHAEHEQIEIRDIPRRAALLCRLLEALD